MLSRALPMNHLTAMTRLLRLPLALTVAVTALAGALAWGAPLSGLSLWALGWGVFLLAAASSVLNQVLERASDALMRRTCQRPLASGALSPRAGAAVGALLGSGGLAVLATGSGPGPAMLGLAALAWYLLVYTPLKRVSSLAVLAGTPCGAVPPLMGWLAAGGPLPAPQPLALALFMLLWQVPHYWLLALPDRMELRAAGFRVLPELSDRRLLAVSHRWLLGLALATLLLPALSLPAQPLLQGVVVGLALALVITSSWFWYRSLFAVTTARQLRRLLYLYLGLVLLTMLVDALLHH
ncbi:MAG: UbiA family prenyltransferase [Desulfuromonadales bacterium]|nr:UbiA family prenyltransferase [Desulfuromonadales bacterium]